MSIRRKSKCFFKKIKNILKITSDKNNRINIDTKIMGNIKLKIGGVNNTVILNNLRIERDSRITIEIYGNNNIVSINDISLSQNISIQMGQRHDNFGEIENAQFTINKNTSIEDMKYITYNSNSKCIIGANCMLSFGIMIYNTDAHAILDYATNRLVNYIDGIYIGNHCWIGMNVTLLKNTVIPDDCIIGAQSVVSGKLLVEHAVYAGNPVHLVKENRTWDANGKKHGYIENVYVYGYKKLT